MENRIPTEHTPNWLRSLATLVCVLSCAGAFHPGASAAAQVDLSGAVVVTRPGELPNAERAAATVLVEEVEKRTGIRLAISTTWPIGKPVIAITSQPEVSYWGHSIQPREGTDLPEKRPDGYRLLVDTQKSSSPVVWVVGSDARGTLYGVGALLRNLDWGKGRALLPASLDTATAPAYPIRGHQLGYRARANSWDAWDVAQFDQYIRELAFFGINSVENIPFQDDRTAPLMKLSRREMNKKMSEIC
ncbi:MAG: glycoside hydrolase family 20 zincin-like fold domain-containing protein, partial [bacterium]